MALQTPSLSIIYLYKIDCKIPNLIYNIYCDCQFPSDYVGSYKNMKQRWIKHKGDIRNGNWTPCGLTRHFGENHTNNIEEAIGNLKRWELYLQA